MPAADTEALTRVLAGEPRIRLAYLFGSVASGDEHPGSDVDVAVLALPPMSLAERERLRSALAGAAGRPVDLVALDEAPPLLAREVIGGRLLLCRDEGEREELEARVMARFLDTAHLRAVQMNYLRQRIGNRNARSPAASSWRSTRPWAAFRPGCPSHSSVWSKT